ncbi:MAG: phosphotransferase [Ilumatobacteraceae bacterium]
MLHEFGSKARAWFLADGERVGLTHNDFRLDNLLFTGEAGGCVVLDWQTFMVSHIGRDLGMFIGASIPTDLRVAHGNELLTAYRDQLTSLDVTGYSQANSEHDLRYGSFHGIHNALLLHRAVDMTDRGTQMFDAWLARACQTVDDLDALQVLS